MCVCVCFRRRQAKLQKELADAAKEPLPIEACVSEFVSDVIRCPREISMVTADRKK